MASIWCSCFLQLLCFAFHQSQSVASLKTASFSLFCVQAYDRVAPIVQDAANTASPYVKSGLKTAGDVAAPALRAVEPSLKVDTQSSSVYMQPDNLSQHLVTATTAYFLVSIRQWWHHLKQQAPLQWHVH